MDSIRELGRFLTVNNPFKNHKEIITKFLFNIDFDEIIEPFAGEGHLIDHIKEVIDITKYTISMYDLIPIEEKNILQNDSILNFPSRQEGKKRLCITNPPYLYKGSSTSRGIKILDEHWGSFDNLWKSSVNKIMKNCEYGILIIPPQVLKIPEFKQYLLNFIPIYDKLFNSTETPVALCLFDFTTIVNDTLILIENDFISYRQSESKHSTYFQEAITKQIYVNHPHGQFWISLTDKRLSENIKAISLKDLNKNFNRKTRCYLKVYIPGLKLSKVEDLIKIINEEIENYRQDTKNIFLSVFKGNRTNIKKWRNRMSIGHIRQLINNALIKLGY